MDKSEEYVVMCTSAIEVTGEWKHSKRTSGDFYVSNLWAVYVTSDIDQDDKNCTWIPRFDQLMEIYKEHSKDTIIDIFVNLSYNITTVNERLFVMENREYYSKFNTIEKIMLCFIMEKMYSKRWNWNNKNWEKE